LPSNFVAISMGATTSKEYVCGKDAEPQKDRTNRAGNQIILFVGV
jgi:hypothetical protein